QRRNLLSVHLLRIYSQRFNVPVEPAAAKERIGPHKIWELGTRSRGCDYRTYLPPHGAAQMTKAKTLQDLFHDTLKDIYFAEKKIMSALPKMAKAAQSEDLRAAFEKHLEETEGQVERLEAVFKEIDAPPQGKTCDAIMGILDEGKEIMSEYKGAPALDAGLLAAA